MRRHRFFAEVQALAQDEAENQRRPTGGHVHYRAAREVDRFDFCVRIPDSVHEAVYTPDHVCQWQVDYEHPEEDEEHDC